MTVVLFQSGRHSPRPFRSNSSELRISVPEDEELDAFDDDAFGLDIGGSSPMHMRSTSPTATKPVDDMIAEITDLKR